MVIDNVYDWSSSKRARDNSLSGEIRMRSVTNKGELEKAHIFITVLVASIKIALMRNFCVLTFT